MQAPLKSKAPEGYTLHEIDVVDPRSLVAYLWNDVGLNIPHRLVADYWAHYRSDDVQAAWATWSRASESHVPIALYGDDCKLRPYEKMIGIFMSFPLWRPRSVRCSKFLLCAVQLELEYKHLTVDCILRYLVWSLNCLYIGRWPRVGCDGEPLSPKQAQKAGQEIVPGRQFAVTELKGDWAWFKKIMRFKSSWKGGARVPVCFQCRARSDWPVLYYEVGPSDPCWQTQYTLLEWLAEQCPSRP